MFFKACTGAFAFCSCVAYVVVEYVSGGGFFFPESNVHRLELFLTLKVYCCALASQRRGAGGQT